jgi:hypothetical protein
MYAGISLRGGGLPRSYIPYLNALTEPAVAADPLARLSDDFSGDQLDPSWSFYNRGLVATSSVGGGTALNYQITAGGVAGSFWYNEFAGSLIYKLVEGPCDMRARIRARNSANSGNPPLGTARIVGIAAHDPLRPPTPGATLNYVHTGTGVVAPAVTTVVEWKTTDLNVSTFNTNTWPVGGVGDLDADLRIVRRTDLQIFDIYVKPSTTPLNSPSGWTLQQSINRTSTAQPVRAAAEPLPDVLQWGLMVYSSEAIQDIRSFVRQVLFSTPT